MILVQPCSRKHTGKSPWSHCCSLGLPDQARNVELHGAKAEACHQLAESLLLLRSKSRGNLADCTAVTYRHMTWFGLMLKMFLAGLAVVPWHQAVSPSVMTQIHLIWPTVSLRLDTHLLGIEFAFATAAVYLYSWGKESKLTGARLGIRRTSTVHRLPPKKYP